MVLVDATPAYADYVEVLGEQQLIPRVSARPQDDMVGLYEWMGVSEVTVTIDDDMDPSNGSLWSGPLPVDSEGQAWTRIDFDIQAGQVVIASDGERLKLVVLSEALTAWADVNADIICGYATPGSNVEAGVHDEDSDSAISTWLVASPVDGYWEWAAGPLVDLVPGQFVCVGEHDETWDITDFELQITQPVMDIKVDENIVDCYGWIQGEQAVLTIDDDGDISNGFIHQESQTVSGQGFAFTDLAEQGVDIQPGQFVTVSAPSATKVHEVLSVEITSVNIDTDTVSGVAGPSAALLVDVCPPQEGDWPTRRVTADENGMWTADFATIGPEEDEWQTWDIRVGSDGYARQFDNDGDCSRYLWRVEYPEIEVGAIAGPIDPVPVGTPVAMSVAFVDPFPQEWYAARWDWGDGLRGEGALDLETLTAYGTHVYDTPGVYVVGLHLESDGRAADADYRYVVVYDPEGGFASGGGWIHSPSGAYLPDPALSGKATFGFVSKYHAGADTPSGATEFQFHAADMDFRSTDYEWLVIAGTKAQYKGHGSLCGTDGYGFMLTASDGDLRDDKDTFRIKIWNDATDELVYDNQLYEPDDAFPTTILGGGNIVIHNPRLTSVKVGVHLSLTGGFENLSYSAVEAVRLAVRDIDSVRVGRDDCVIELVVRDDESDPERATQVAQELVDEGVVAVIGPLTSACANAAMPVYEENGVPVVSGSASADRLASGFSYFHRTCQPNAIAGLGMADWLSCLGARRVFVVSNGTEWGGDIASGTCATLTELGVICTQVSAPDWIDESQAWSIAEDAAAFGADSVVCCASSWEAAVLRTALVRAGLTDALFIGSDAVADPQFVEVARPGIAEMSLAVMASLRTDVMPGYDTFVADFQEATGIHPAPYAAEYHDALASIASAIAQAQSVDGAAIRTALDQGTYSGVLGAFGFSETGEIEIEGFDASYLRHLAVVEGHWEDLDSILDIGDPWLTSEVTGTRYRVIGPSTWSDAEARAVSLGGHLVTLGSPEEEEWVVREYGLDFVWCGLNDRQTEGDWTWSSGEPVTYTNWIENEPNDAGGSEDAAVFNCYHEWFDQWGWNDISEDEICLGIVEAP